MDYGRAAGYISQIPKFTRKNDAANTRELLRRLGHPEESLRVVHVAGTNGKGSTCAFLESIFRTAGCRTGLFTSPHLVRINERFQVDRKEITDREFAEVFGEVKAAVDDMSREGFFHPSYFEFLFAMGMLYFRRQKIDLLLCETGLGGRLDATNVIREPVLTVITSISRDHMEYLGETVAEIAGEKAGILKRGVPVVYDASCAEAAAVIEARAAQTGSLCVPRERSMTKITQRDARSVTFDLRSPGFCLEGATVPFCADYQADNASLAILAADILRKMPTGKRPPRVPSDRQILEGIASARWSGRMEELVPDVFVDGAHNEDGIRRFLETVRRMAERRPVSLLFAAVSDKNWREMIREICEQVSFRCVTATQVGGSRQVEARILAEEFRAHTDAEVFAVPDPGEAYLKARSLQGDSVLYCAGSLYLAGAVEAEKGQELC